VGIMDKKEQEFLKHLRETFRVEAEEHLRNLSAGFMELEKTTEPVRAAQIVETVFREAHSLKGAARSVNLKEIESLCQPLESALAALKRGEITLAAPLFDLFHQTVDSLAGLITAMDVDRTSAERADLRELGRRLAEAAQGSEPPAPPDSPPLNPQTPIGGAGPGIPPSTPPPAKPAETRLDPETPAPEAAPMRTPVQKKTVAQRPAGEGLLAPLETVRIPITKLDPLLLQAEEMIQAKLAGGQRAAELREIQEALVSWKFDWAKWTAQRPAHSGEIPEWAAARMDALAGKVASVSQAFEQDQRALRHMVDDHLDAMKQVLMLPVATLVEVFPSLVRGLGRDQGKEVDLVMDGTGIEMDKRILEELKDPLIHVLRNCVDHGIEKPTERLRQGKAGRGTITLAFSTRDNRQVEILVSDDGAGINLERVRAAAARAGSLAAEAAAKLDSQGTLALIFQSGISTSEIITDISGRGLGLAIVREKVEKFGGSVSVDTHAGAGTTFRLLLPLTLATFRGVRVRAREQVFVLPSAQVERAVRVDLDEIETVENRETIRLDGSILSLVRLGDVLALPLRNNGHHPGKVPSRHTAATEGEPSNHLSVLILALAEKRIAVQVDEVLAEEEVLVKGLGGQLRRVRNISGATVLGAGRVVPVLNVGDLMDSAVRPGAAVGEVAAVEKTAARTGRILVAEDSITARTLLKNILETGGYQVTTAVDGADAFTQLRSGEFDLVVSDVDMPRMSGFELTTKIRLDKKLGELPVVLVTALESRPDRERGIEVGANAYIIKSSFDQSNLLNVIQRLL
jgi:two-component system chemotaxis sensor kinase CheA